MYEWHKQIQVVVKEIDDCIKNKNDEILTLSFLAKKLGYSEFYVFRKFKEISGMNLRDYMRQRNLSFALKEVRDTTRGLLDSISGKLDDNGGDEPDSGSGQIMAFINEPEGRI